MDCKSSTTWHPRNDVMDASLFHSFQHEMKLEGEWKGVANSRRLVYAVVRVVVVECLMMMVVVVVAVVVFIAIIVVTITAASMLLLLLIPVGQALFDGSYASLQGCRRM
jgi:hypothetical protein